MFTVVLNIKHTLHAILNFLSKTEKNFKNNIIWGLVFFNYSVNIT